MSDEHEALREQLAALAHTQWTGWMAYMLGRFDTHHNADGTEEWNVSAQDARRWRRQMQTPYAELSEPEKESDRKEADRVLALLPQGKRDALIAALVQEYADLLARGGRDPNRMPDGEKLWYRRGGRDALQRVAERLGVTDLHERAAAVVARGDGEEGP